MLNARLLLPVQRSTLTLIKRLKGEVYICQREVRNLFCGRAAQAANYDEFVSVGAPLSGTGRGWGTSNHLQDKPSRVSFSPFLPSLPSSPRSSSRPLCPEPSSLHPAAAASAEFFELRSWQAIVLSSSIKVWITDSVYTWCGGEITERTSLDRRSELWALIR